MLRALETQLVKSALARSSGHEVDLTTYKWTQWEEKLLSAVACFHIIIKEILCETGLLRWNEGSSVGSFAESSLRGPR